MLRASALLCLILFSSLSHAASCSDQARVFTINSPLAEVVEFGTVEQVTKKLRNVSRVNEDVIYAALKRRFQRDQEDLSSETEGPLTEWDKTELELLRLHTDFEETETGKIEKLIRTFIESKNKKETEEATWKDIIENDNVQAFLEATATERLYIPEKVSSRSVIDFMLRNPEVFTSKTKAQDITYFQYIIIHGKAADVKRALKTGLNVNELGLRIRKVSRGEVHAPITALDLAIELREGMEKYEDVQRMRSFLTYIPQKPNQEMEYDTRYSGGAFIKPVPKPNGKRYKKRETTQHRDMSKTIRHLIANGAIVVNELLID